MHSVIAVYAITKLVVDTKCQEQHPINYWRRPINVTVYVVAGTNKREEWKFNLLDTKSNVAHNVHFVIYAHRNAWGVFLWFNIRPGDGFGW